MKFRNDKDHPVKFTTRGKTYEAAPNGGEVTVPDELAWCVKSRGVLLVRADTPKPVPPADPPPAKAPKEKAGDK